MSTLQPSKPDFDYVASVYRWAEYLALGSQLQSTRKHFLSALNERRHALILGDGDGRFLASLLRSNRSLSATAVDTSKRMLRLLKKRCAEMDSRLVTMQATAQSVQPSACTDLIVSHFFLDCLTQQEVDSLVAQIANCCRPGTWWLISEFQIPPRSPWRFFAKTYIRMLYFAFFVTTGLCVRQLPETRMPLSSSGFERVAYHQSLGGLLYSEIWELRSNAVSTHTQPPATMGSSTLNEG